MHAINAFKTGLKRATAEPKMVLVLYLLNLLLALPLALALRSVLVSGFGSSMAPAEIMEGLSITVFQDFMLTHGVGIRAVTGQLLTFFILSMVLQTFLAGGILSRLQEQGKKMALADFFKGCGAFFFRFFRLFLLFAVLMLLATVIVGAVAISLASSLGENAASEITFLWLNGGALLVILIPLLLLKMISDYARIQTVLYDERSMVKTALRAAKFVFRRFLKTISLELMLGALALLLFGVYIWLDLSLGMTTDAAIILMFIIQQVYMVSRAWTKVLFFSGEMTLFQAIQASTFSEAREEAALPTAERA